MMILFAGDGRSVMFFFSFFFFLLLLKSPSFLSPQGEASSVVRMRKCKIVTTDLEWQREPAEDR